MNKSVLLLAAMALAAPAAAEGSVSQLDSAIMLQDCSVGPCWVDSHGQKIANGLPWTRRQGAWFRVELDSGGFIEGIDQYYLDAGCTQGPYLWTSNPFNGVIRENLPFYAPFDGQVLWGPTGPAQIVTPKGFRYNLGACQPLNSDPIVVHPAKVIDSTTYHPPFSITQ